MKLSILILTHNRPELFRRCLGSVLNYLPENVEILVNNDGNFKEELSKDIVKYYYRQSHNISDLYKHLFDEAKGEYVFFLEDDDYILPNFFDAIDYNYDINYMNYRTYDIRKTLKKRKEPFTVETENKDFQLSQILFKKSLVTEFPDGNDLHNDWNLFQHIKNDSLKVIPEYTWVQTIDGKDNISFPEYNKDDRWSKSV